MISEHRLVFSDSSDMSAVPDRSVHLVVTSPPYPMIAMWDEQLCRSPAVKAALSSGNGNAAFELMHRQLDPVWEEVHRILVPGGIACINIGDATRTLRDTFALYPNHARIITRMIGLGFGGLPAILWRKQTNAPSKFMGSGMMPPGAYVTLEHEYILVFRKGDKRRFTTPAEKENRRRSAYFWEERNLWFSDVWMDLKGTRQQTRNDNLRDRSGAFPFELAYRLIAMFSVMGDTVLDPFMGTGTTLFAAAATGRNSTGYELDGAFRPLIEKGWERAADHACNRVNERLNDHGLFVQNRKASGKIFKYANTVYGFPVVTRQETELMLPLLGAIRETAHNHYRATYDMPDATAEKIPADVDGQPDRAGSGQLSLFK